MDKKRLLLIVNPASGIGKIKSQLFKVVDIFSRGGYEVTVYPTKARRDAELKAFSSAKDYDLLVCAGGDGTLNETVTGVIKSGANVPLGYIPAGTLNEWSSGLKISRNIETAAKDIVGGKLATLDLGGFDDKYFTYTASFGAFTEASYSAPQDVKNILGQAAYFFEGIKSLGNIKPITLTVKTETKTVTGDFLFGAVTNSFSVGGVVRLNEALVTLNDGFFEVLLIRNPANIAELQNIIDGILKIDFNRRGIEFLRAAEIVVESGKPIDWTLDGEHARSDGTVKIRNLKNHLKLIVPDRLKNA